MRYLVCIIFFVSLEAGATNWILFTHLDDSNTYIDSESFIYDEIAGKRVSFQFWMKTEFNKSKPLGSKDKRKFNNLLTLYRIYCNDSRYQLLTGIARLKENHVHTENYYDKYGYLAPETLLEEMYKTHCVTQGSLENTSPEKEDTNFQNAI